MIPLMQIIKIMCIWAHKPYMLMKHAKIKQYTIMACICLNLYKKSKIIYIMLKRIGPKLSIKTYLLLKKKSNPWSQWASQLEKPKWTKRWISRVAGNKSPRLKLTFHKQNLLRPFKELSAPPWTKWKKEMKLLSPSPFVSLISSSPKSANLVLCFQL